MPRRLTIVIHSLEGGGAERVAAGMANHWANSGNDVTLVTLSGIGNEEYALEPGVSRSALDVMHHSQGVLQAIRHNRIRIKQLRAAIEQSQPDTVISLTDKTNIVTLLACRGCSAPIIICERIDPRHHDIGRIWSWLRTRTYPRCAGLVVQTTGVADYLRPLVAGQPVYVIPNSVEPCKTSHSDRQTDSKTILAMGRLDRQKGFDLLIRAFAMLATDQPDWSLRVVGEGEQRPELEKLIDELGLEDRVELPGWTTEPEKEFAKAGMFVLPSRYEGFPNALLEAMACGLPCISFECPSGPGEIIRDNIDGMLVAAEDIGGLAAAISALAGDGDRRIELGRSAPEVVERFSAERHFELWESVLEGATEQQFYAAAEGT